MLFSPHWTSSKTRSSTTSSSSGSIRRCSSSSPAILGGSRLSTRTCHPLPETVLVVHSLNDGIAVVSLLLLEPGDQEAQPRSPGRNEPFPASVIDLGAAACAGSRSVPRLRQQGRALGQSNRQRQRWV